MSKIQVSKFRLSRMLGVSIHGHPKDAFNFRNYFCGQHGQKGMRKASDFAMQLKAKQTLKFHHNLTEKQLRNLYKKAENMKGDTGDNLIGLLNRRLDSVIFWSNFAPTFYSACQLVSHGHVLVNGKRVNIRSYFVKPGDTITLKDSAKKMAIVGEATAKEQRKTPEFLSVNKGSFSINFVRVPLVSEVPYNFVPELQLIIEYYSR